MTRSRRTGLLYLISLIAISSASPLFADDDLCKVLAPEMRDLALRNFRANSAALKGVQCKLTTTTTTKLDPNSRQNENTVESTSPKGAEDRDDNEQSDFPVLFKTARAIGRRNSVVDIPSGTCTTTIERRVFFCGPNVRSESYVDDSVESRFIRNGVDCSYESTDVSSVFGTPLTRRSKIDDPLTRSGPIVDPRDLGASSGVGRLEEMLATWEAISAVSCVAKCGRSGLIAIKLHEPKTAREHPDFVNECILYLDPKTNLLPVITEHFQQGNLWLVAEVTHIRCDWLPETCYLATLAEYAMPSDSKQTDYRSVSEIDAQSRQRFLVTEATAFEPTENDKMFRIRATSSPWSHELDATCIAAPPEPAPVAIRTEVMSDNLIPFVSALLVIATASVGITLRQQASAR